PDDSREKLPCRRDVTVERFRCAVKDAMLVLTLRPMWRSLSNSGVSWIADDESCGCRMCPAARTSSRRRRESDERGGGFSWGRARRGAHPLPYVWGSIDGARPGSTRLAAGARESQSSLHPRL